MSDASAKNGVLNGDARSTPTSPMNLRRAKHHYHHGNGVETLKNSSSEPNVSTVKRDEDVNDKTAAEGNNNNSNCKRNSKSEDCLLDIVDKSSGDILISKDKSREEASAKVSIIFFCVLIFEWADVWGR